MPQLPTRPAHPPHPPLCAPPGYSSPPLPPPTFRLHGQQQALGQAREEVGALQAGVGLQLVPPERQRAGAAAGAVASHEEGLACLGRDAGVGRVWERGCEGVRLGPPDGSDWLSGTISHLPGWRGCSERPPAAATSTSPWPVPRQPPMPSAGHVSPVRGVTPLRELALDHVRSRELMLLWPGRQAGAGQGAGAGLRIVGHGQGSVRRCMQTEAAQGNSEGWRRPSWRSKRLAGKTLPAAARPLRQPCGVPARHPHHKLAATTMQGWRAGCRRWWRPHDSPSNSTSVCACHGAVSRLQADEREPNKSARGLMAVLPSNRARSPSRPAAGPASFKTRSICLQRH